MPCLLQAALEVGHPGGRRRPSDDRRSAIELGALRRTLQLPGQLLGRPPGCLRRFAVNNMAPLRPGSRP